MRKTSFVTMTTLLACICLFGCAGSQMVARQPLETDLSSFSSLSFTVESGVADDVTKEKADLEKQVVEKLKLLNLFSQVQIENPSQTSPNNLLVKVTISNINKVSGTTRFFAGAFAGQASLTADIAFIDVKAGKTLGSFFVTGKSGGTGMSRGTGDAVKKTADGIVNLIAQHRKANVAESSSMQKLWLETTKTDKKGAYEKFLESYPSSEYSAEAHRRLGFFFAIDSANSTDAVEALIKKHQGETFVYNAIPKLENFLIDEIEMRGPSDRLIITALMPTGNEAITGVTFSEGDEPETFKVSTEFPGDAIMLGGSPFNTRVHRYRGKVPVGGALDGYVFISEGDKLNLLTFAQIRRVGYVYLRGRGKVIFPNGKEVRLGY